jgi:hypothetical protein
VLPNQLSLFAAYLLVWWAGVELCREYLAQGGTTLARQGRLVAMLLAVAVVWLAPLSWRGDTPLHLGASPLLQVRHFAATAGFIVVAAMASRWGWRGPGALLRPFVALAPVSYFL